MVDIICTDPLISRLRDLAKLSYLDCQIQRVDKIEKSLLLCSFPKKTAHVTYIHVLCIHLICIFFI